jgi:aquaporin Z
VLEGDYARRGIAEFIGAFALVFVGAGSLIYGDVVGTALAYGLVIAVMVSSFARISGGHFNPAVTFAFLITRRIAPALAGFYWVLQIGGAAVAALLLKWVLPHQTTGLHLGAPALSSTIDPAKGVVIEAVLTFLLLWVIFATIVDPDGSFAQIAGLAIGFTISADVLLGGGLTGAAMNPARALGPEIASGHWTDFWIWILGPLVGATLAAVLYDALFLRPDPSASSPTDAPV